MQTKHEPDEQFVDKLEWQLAGEARRRNRDVAAVHPVWKLARVAVVVLASMAFGAAAMGASYQIEESWRQELLEADLEVRLELARRRLELVGEEAAAVERRAAVGNASAGERDQMRMYLADSEAQVRLLELQLEEVRASGREPVGEVSSPVIRGRDFVTERLEIELQMARRVLELAQPELARARVRSDVGTGSVLELEAIRLAVAQHERRVESLRNRLDVRSAFVAGEVTGVEAELMVRIGDTEADAALARQRFELLQRQLEMVRTRVEIGVDPAIALGQPELAVAEAEAELRLTDVELEVLRRELEAERRR